MTTELRQSVEYIQFFASIGAAAIVSWLVIELTNTPLNYVSTNAETELVEQSNNWFDILITNLPIIFLFIAGMGAISFTVFKSEFT
jgi:hypothetical protein